MNKQLSKDKILLFNSKLSDKAKNFIFNQTASISRNNSKDKIVSGSLESIHNIATVEEKNKDNFTSKIKSFGNKRGIVS